MSCRWIARRLSAYQDGALDSKTAQQFERHLEDCEGCRLELHVLRRLSALMKPGLSSVDAPEGFGQRLMARLPARRTAAHAHVLRRTMGWSAGAALLILCLLVAWWHVMHVPRSGGEQPSRQVIVQHGDIRPAPGTPQEGRIVTQPATTKHKVAPRAVMVRRPGQPDAIPGAKRRGVEKPQPLPVVKPDRLPQGRYVPVVMMTPLARPSDPGVEVARIPIGSGEGYPDETAHLEADRPQSGKPSISLVAEPAEGDIAVKLTIQ